MSRRRNVARALFEKAQLIHARVPVQLSMQPAQLQNAGMKCAGCADRTVTRLGRVYEYIRITWSIGRVLLTVPSNIGVNGLPSSDWDG